MVVVVEVVEVVVDWEEVAEATACATAWFCASENPPPSDIERTEGTPEASASATAHSMPARVSEEAPLPEQPRTCPNT